MKFSTALSVASAFQLPTLDDIESIQESSMETLKDLMTIADSESTKLLKDLGVLDGSKKCPKIEVQPDFDLNKYLGGWYELYRDVDIPAWWYTGECTTAHYALKDETHVIVDNSSQDLNPDGSVKPREPIKTHGEATYQDQKVHDAHLKVRFSKFQPWGSYNVLSTDYETYSLVYQCDNFLLDQTKLEHLWLLTRKPLDFKNSDDAAEIERLTGIAKEFVGKNVPYWDFDQKMHHTRQKQDCSYF